MDHSPDDERAARQAARAQAPWWIELVAMLAVFAVATAIATAAGAANFGTAMTFGQIAFAAALVWVLLRRA